MQGKGVNVHCAIYEYDTSQYIIQRVDTIKICQEFFRVAIIDNVLGFG
jgi:hypothetical protein